MKFLTLSCLLIFLLSGCKNQISQSPAFVEPYVQADDTVGFDAVPSATASGGVVWNATYSSPHGTARFQIELGPTKPIKDDPSFAFGKGRFVALPNSNPGPLLDALKTVLQAKSTPHNVTRVQALEFTFASLGTGMTRRSDGSFDMKQPGSWTAMKLFIAQPKGDEEAEVYLNLSAAARKAEFSMKDPDYGDDILQQLAKVL